MGGGDGGVGTEGGGGGEVRCGTFLKKRGGGGRGVDWRGWKRFVSC